MISISGLLIILFIIFFIFSFIKVLKIGDDLFATFYFLLFIYTIFTQIAYVFVPDLAVFAKVFFGSHLFFYYWLFVSLSFVATYWLFLILDARRKKFGVQLLQSVNLNRHKVRFPEGIYFSVYGFYLMTLTWIFINSLDKIQYAKISDIWIGYIINLQPYFLLIMYMKLRGTEKSLKKIVSRILFIFSFSLFLIISFRAGQRLLGVSFLIGLTTFEYSPFLDTLKKIRTRTIILVAIGTFTFLFLASSIVAMRDKYGGAMPLSSIGEIFESTNNSGEFTAEKFLYNDYFAPSSLIFVSIYWDWIDPAEVFKSNLYNSIVFLGYPYLQNTLSEVANPNYNYSRSESYAYYIFTEGFNFAGWFGFLYNALIINLGFGLWRRYMNSNDVYFNRYSSALLSVLLISIVRGQSIHFFRSLYLVIFPSIIMLSLSLGYFPSWPKRLVKRNL